MKTIILSILLIFSIPAVGKEYVSCKFSLGQIVVSKVDQRRGQIVKIYARQDGCRYEVRFTTDEKKTPYVLVYINEFEIEKAK